MKKECKMQTFLTALAAVAHLYDWKMENGVIVGKAKGKRITDDPLTAIENSKRRLKRRRLLRTDENQKVASRLGYNQEEFSTIDAAITGTENRGYAQILRGKIKKTVGL